MTSVEVVKHEENYALKVKGHANFDTSGKDIVCSAVSILTYTLINMLQIMDDYNRLKSMSINCQRGDVEITAKAEKAHTSEADTVFNTIVTGYELLQETYPDNVQVNVKGVSYN